MYKRQFLDVSLGQKTYRQRFLLADVHRPILGNDFFESTGIIVDIRNSRLLAPDTYDVVVSLEIDEPSDKTINMSLTTDLRSLSQRTQHRRWLYRLTR